MPLATFLRQLHENGRVRVHPQSLASADARALAALNDAYRLAAQDLAGAPPPFAADAAAWAAVQLYQAGQFLCYREFGPDQIHRAFSRPCPRAPSPETCFSVDLSFRYLPDLLVLARGVSRDDPLLLGLLALAAAWPLSSVGVRELTLPAEALDSFYQHPGLRRLYADRVLARDDVARLKDARVKADVRDSIGLFSARASKGIQAEILA